MTSRTAWVMGSAIAFVSVGVTVFSIIIAAHEEILERKLSEQHVALMSERDQGGWPSSPSPFGGVTSAILGTPTAYKIIGDRIHFTPRLMGRNAVSKEGFSRIYGAHGTIIKDPKLLNFLANEILRFRRIYGRFDYDVETVELRFSNSGPFCSKIGGETGAYQILIDRNFYGAASIRSIAHEVTHMAAPFLHSWYMEGLADIRGDQSVSTSGLDMYGALALQCHLHNPSYTTALSLMQQLELIVGRSGLIELVKTTKPTVWTKAIKPLPGEVWGTPLNIDIDAWLAKLSRSKRAACREIILREGGKLKTGGSGVHPQLGIQLPN